MSISNQEAESIIIPYIQKYDHAFDSKQLETVVGIYAPTAVLVQVGKGAAYGRDAIREEVKAFMAGLGPETKTTVSQQKYGGANGYIVYTGYFITSLPNGGELKGDFEQLWKKGADGTYLIVYDHFTLG